MKCFQIKFLTFIRHFQKFKINQNVLKTDILNYSSILNEFKKITQNKYVLLSNATIFRFIFFDSITNTNSNNLPRYWVNRSIDQLIEEADNLYDSGNFLEVYEILNRLQHYGNIEIHWRVCRALFKLSSCQNIPGCIRENMLIEAYNLITETMKLNENHPEVHKWMAIILDAKSGFEGVLQRIKVANVVKEHMKKSLDMNPNDATVLYMLGCWCYEMTKLTWIQRNVMKILFSDPPESSYREAYEYFKKVEELHPRTFISNIYMLGLCCYEMDMLYRARYYLKIASEFPVTTQYQKLRADDAKKLAEKLKDYDLTLDALIFKPQEINNS